MFKNTFSFDGKIGRREFGTSLVIFVISAVILQAVAAILIGTKTSDDGVILPVLCVTFIPLLWFLLAQGAKRCKDIGCSAWFQLIPFFAIYLLIAESRAQN